MTFTPFGDTGLGSIPHDLESMIHEELAGDEKLSWVGRPRPGRMVAAALPSFLIGACFTAFALFWIYGASGGLGPPRPRRGNPAVQGLFPLFGIPFVLVGLGMLASPFVAARNARKTCYALTDRRAIVWEGGLWHGTRVRSYRPGDLRSMARNQRGDGSGDLIFEEVTTFGNRGRQQTVRRGFLAIEDVREVEGLVRSTLLHN